MPNDSNTLTDAERHLIMQTVESQDMDLAVFIRLFYEFFFELHPETRDFFSADLDQQEKKLLAALTHIIEAVDHPEKLKKILKEQGTKHQHLQIHDRHFNGFIVSFTRSMEEILGPKWTPNANKAWSKFLYSIAQQMGFQPEPVA